MDEAYWITCEAVKKNLVLCPRICPRNPESYRYKLSM